MMEIIRSIWQAIPGSLKRFVGYGVASGVALSLVLAMYLFWGTGYLQDRLGIMATKGDIEAQTDQFSESIPQAIDEAVSRYDTTLKTYLEQERRLAEDTILRPMLSAIMELDKRQRDILRGMGATADKMDAMTKSYDEQLERLMKAQGGTETDRLLRELLLRVEEQNEQLEELRRNQGKKTQRIRL